VSESDRVLIILILVFILMGISVIFVSGLMSRRTVQALFKLFREAQALSPETARFAEEIGFKGRSILNFMVVRDYKPQALQLLIKENIIQVTEGGRLFLSEQTLADCQLSALDKKI
jgi:hypothetical protein